MLFAALVPLVVVAVAFVGYCLRDLFLSPVESPARWWWSAAIVFSVPLGGLIWLLVGKPRA